MSGQAQANVWHTLSLELGRNVARELLIENAPTSPPVLRRMDIAQRTVRACCGH